MGKTRPVNPVDKHVGSRIRLRRMTLNMSQKKLGDAAGLTVQQVQEYEKGTNRPSAEQLTQISNVLQVPFTFFFERISRTEGSADAPSAARKRFKTSSGKYAEVRVLDANTATFGNDLLSAFRENVTKAREENLRLFGSPDRVPDDY